MHLSSCVTAKLIELLDAVDSASSEVVIRASFVRH